MKATLRQFYWAALAAVGLVATPAAPSFAGVMFNHTEPFSSR